MRESDTHGTLASHRPVIYKQFPTDPPQKALLWRLSVKMTGKYVTTRERKDGWLEKEDGGCGTNGSS